MATELKVIKQGAEAKIYVCNYLGRPMLIKERFPKTYRQPDLDNAITKERMRSEARGIIRSKGLGILTPTIYLVDFNRRRIYMEHFEKNITVKEYLCNLSKYSPGNETEGLQLVAEMIGETIGKLHDNNITHGDLTTSNMLLVPKDLNDGKWTEKREFHIALIDFGLSGIDTSVEDKAVDLYVMERSFISTHNDLETLWEMVVDSYEYMNDTHEDVMERYRIVRERGRKRIMIG